MKKISFILLCAVCALSVNAQRYMSITQKDGSVTEYSLSNIDSIHFFVKDNTTPEPPVVNPDNPVENGHEYVDLGLPSGTLWAKMNIGATAITDYGYYFAWGETTPHQLDGDEYSSFFASPFSLKNYKWYTSDTIVETDADGFETTTITNKYTKYCTDSKYGPVDNLTTLELEDDAAHVHWGGAWRMPTEAEFEELLNNCTWTWATLNGVNGYKVSSKVEGNTAYIFLPAVGYGDGDHLYYQRNAGYFWLSSLNPDNMLYAQQSLFAASRAILSSRERYYGLTIRPVCSSKK